MLTVKSNGENKDFEICPEGTFIARIFQIVDLGTVEKQFNNDKPKDTHEVFVGFELLDESAVTSEGKPFTRGETFTASLHEKAKLRKALEAIRGRKFTDEELKGFELGKIMGAYCQITVTHTTKADKTYANITAYSPLHKSMSKPSPVNANVVFDLDADDYLDSYEKLPKWQKERIADSHEWKGASGVKKAATPKEEKFEDDVPF